MREEQLDWSQSKVFLVCYKVINNLVDVAIGLSTFYTLGLQAYRLLEVKKVSKVLPSHMAHRAALISVSIALSQTPACDARPRIRG